MHKIKNHARFLLDNGLIFEINRKILHPLGYALAVDIDPDDHRKVVIDGLYESEDDPEGFLFDSEAFVEGKAKYDKFMEDAGNSKIEVRKSKLGYIIQTDAND